jgi:hypothetical protein
MGNHLADGVSPAVQAERINALAQIAGSALANLEPLRGAFLAGPQSPRLAPNVNPHPAGLGLNLGPSNSMDPLTSFASLNVNDRRGSADQALGRCTPMPPRGLRMRQSDAGLRLSGAPFSTRVRASDAGLPRASPMPSAGLTFGLGTLGARRVSDGNIWASGLGDGPSSKGLWPTYASRA